MYAVVCQWIGFLITAYLFGGALLLAVWVMTGGAVTESNEQVPLFWEGATVLLCWPVCLWVLYHDWRDSRGTT